MAMKKGVDKKIERHIAAKRNELIWALHLQDYTFSEIGRIFNINRSTILRIVRKKPADWRPKWEKVHEE